MAKGKNRSVYLDEEIWKQLETASKEDQRSVNWLVALYVKTGLDSRLNGPLKHFKRKVRSGNNKS